MLDCAQYLDMGDIPKQHFQPGGQFILFDNNTLQADILQVIEGNSEGDAVLALRPKESAACCCVAVCVYVRCVNTTS